MKAYRQDFPAIASLITAGQPASMNVVDVNRDSMRPAFAALRARARSSLDPALLVDLERVVHM